MLTGFPAERMLELAEPLDGPSLAAFGRMAGDARVCLVANLPRLGAAAEAGHREAAAGATDDATDDATTTNDATT